MTVRREHSLLFVKWMFRPNSSHVLSHYREVANSHGVLQQSLKADSPAGHSPLRVAPVALNAGQAGITVQTVVAAAALQLHAVEFCSHKQAHKSGRCRGSGFSWAWISSFDVTQSVMMRKLSDPLWSPALFAAMSAGLHLKAAPSAARCTPGHCVSQVCVPHADYRARLAASPETPPLPTHVLPMWWTPSLTMHSIYPLRLNCCKKRFFVISQTKISAILATIQAPACRITVYDNLANICKTTHKMLKLMFNRRNSIPLWRALYIRQKQMP